MSNIGYDEIQSFWKEEKDTEKLLNLEDLKLSKMRDYLSNVRQLLAETAAGNTIQVELLQEEGINIEFMIRDLLMIRRHKIIDAALDGRKPSGRMTLAEEEFYTLLVKRLQIHGEFVNDIITGTPNPTITKTKKIEDSEEDIDESLEYVMVRFLRPVKDAVIGLDEEIYGPYKKEEIDTIPIANARNWLKDGTVARIVPSNGEEDE